MWLGSDLLKFLLGNKIVLTETVFLTFITLNKLTDLVLFNN